MKVTFAIAIAVATSTQAVAQRAVDCAPGAINCTDTIGPTVTSKPLTAVTRAWRDPDAGDYGVPGGVGDPSVGWDLTHGASRFYSAPSSLGRRPQRR
jgi:hypothetical protein